MQKEKERKAAAKRAWEQRHGSVGVGGSQQVGLWDPSGRLVVPQAKQNIRLGEAAL